MKIHTFIFNNYRLLSIDYTLSYNSILFLAAVTFFIFNIFLLLKLMKEL